MSDDLKNICVYCGSSAGTEPAFLQQADALGRLLAEKQIGLVYGGAQIGLMGAIADAALAAGGKVTGVMPEFLVRKEVAHQGLTELTVVDSMHERKMAMAELADAFIAMPGGLGTFEELFEVLTWAQLGLHSKPCGLLNVSGYFNDLVRFLDHAVEQGFVSRENRSILHVEANPATLLVRFENHQPPQSDSWPVRDRG